MSVTNLSEKEINLNIISIISFQEVCFQFFPMVERLFDVNVNTKLHCIMKNIHDHIVSFSMMRSVLMVIIKHYPNITREHIKEQTK